MINGGAILNRSFALSADVLGSIAVFINVASANM